MPGPIQSIERAAAILRVLARGGGPLGVAEVAASVGLPKPTAHGILSTLRSVGFVDHAGGRYALSAALRVLSADRMDDNELRSRAFNWADSLAARARESVRVAAAHDDAELVVVHHVFRPDNAPQALQTGARLPLHATALGKVLLAFDPERAARPRELVSLTRRTVTSAAALARSLGHVREHGWAADVGESLPELASIAAPLRAPGGLVVGAIDICGQVDRLCDARSRPHRELVTHVLDAAHAISTHLGDPP